MSAITRDQVVDFLRGKVSQRTGVEESDITGETVLGEIGVRSIDAVLICGELEDAYELEIDPMLMFNYRTLDEVVTRVMEMLAQQ